ncbi:MAG: hypothetical protein J6T10_11675 [Methanobrevibacter sp.]|nr:hypothetical protein [Methanobrevibacter sp.]
MIPVINFKSETYDIEKIEKFFNDKMKELEYLVNPKKDYILFGDKHHSLWIFLNCCSYIDTLAKLIYPNLKVTNRNIKFINEYIYPNYKNRRLKIFNNTNEEVLFNNQIYYILRCGITHSLAMINTNYIKNGVRFAYEKSIIIGYKSDNKYRNLKHLQKVHLILNNIKQESVMLFAEDFINDIKKATEKLLNEAKQNNSVLNTIINSMNDIQPVKTLEPDETTLKIKKFSDKIKYIKLKIKRFLKHKFGIGK